MPQARAGTTGQMVGMSDSDERPKLHQYAGGATIIHDKQDFSLVLGGPLFQLLWRAHLSDGGLGLLRRRVLFLSLGSWLPLLLLTALEGNLVGSAVAVPFWKDLAVHVRFLVAIPLLVLAELVVHQRLVGIGRTFVDRNLIQELDLPRFFGAISSAFRLRNSVLAECLLLVLVYGFGVFFVWHRYTTLNAPTWYAVPTDGSSRLFVAGYWYRYISLPIFQFLLIRWYFRLFIWGRFLWQVSDIHLDLIPTHPDRVGGLGFLSNTVYAFTLLVVAHGALLSGQIADHIFFSADSLLDFKLEIAIVGGFLVCVIFGPLLTFLNQLAAAKRTGLSEYATLARLYVSEFDRKWLRGGARSDEPLLGSADIQSLADLGNSFEVVKGMRSVPITKDAILQLGVAFLLPLTPLALTIMPLDQLLKQLVGLLL